MCFTKACGALRLLAAGAKACEKWCIEAIIEAIIESCLVGVPNFVGTGWEARQGLSSVRHLVITASAGRFS